MLASWIVGRRLVNGLKLASPVRQYSKQDEAPSLIIQALRTAQGPFQHEEEPATRRRLGHRLLKIGSTTLLPIDVPKREGSSEPFPKAAYLRLKESSADEHPYPGVLTDAAQVLHHYSTLPSGVWDNEADEVVREALGMITICRKWNEDDAIKAMQAITTLAVYSYPPALVIAPHMIIVKAFLRMGRDRVKNKGRVPSDKWQSMAMIMAAHPMLRQKLARATDMALGSFARYAEIVFNHKSLYQEGINSAEVAYIYARRFPMLTPKVQRMALKVFRAFPSRCLQEAVDVRSLSVWTLMTGHLSDMEIQAPTLDLAKRVLFALWRDGPEQLPPAEKGELAAVLSRTDATRAGAQTRLLHMMDSIHRVLIQPINIQHMPPHAIRAILCAIAQSQRSLDSQGWDIMGRVQEEWLQRFTARANLKQCSADDISAVLSNFLMVNALDKVPHKMTDTMCSMICQRQKHAGPMDYEKAIAVQCADIQSINRPIILALARGLLETSQTAMWCETISNPAGIAYLLARVDALDKELAEVLLNFMEYRQYGTEQCLWAMAAADVWNQGVAENCIGFFREVARDAKALSFTKASHTYQAALHVQKHGDEFLRAIAEKALKALRHEWRETGPHISTYPYGAVTADTARRVPQCRVSVEKGDIAPYILVEDPQTNSKLAIEFTNYYEIAMERASRRFILVGPRLLQAQVFREAGMSYAAFSLPMKDSRNRCRPPLYKSIDDILIAHKLVQRQQAPTPRGQG